jgi:predicted alpha/beta superfamily hydrolase
MHIRMLAMWLALLASVPSVAATDSSALPGVLVMTPPLRMPGLERARTLRLWLPEGYANGEARYPVIYMHDGQNLFDAATAYAGEWGVDETMRRFQRERGFAAIVVGIDNGGERRMQELSPWQNPEFGPAEGGEFHDWIVHGLKPFIDSSFRTRPGRASTAIVGSSMGGLAAHYAIHRYPEIFGAAGVMSPSYWFAESVFHHTRNVRLPADARIYLYAGGREGDSMVADAERMKALLQSRMSPGSVFLHVVPDAEHNEAAWRAEFPRVLEALFELEGSERRP